MFYRQCHLKKGNTHQTSWIPEQFAVVNKVLKLREDGVWDDGWVVQTVSETRLDETPDWRKDIRGHRKTTGDSLS